MKRIINIILAAVCILPLSCQKTEEMGILPAPDGVKAVLSDDEKSIEVTWNPVEGAESYIVHYNVEASNAYMKSGLLEETAFSLADFDKGVTYEFKVRCASNTAVSEFSQVATVSVPKPDGSDPSAYTPEISNVRPGLGWINFTMTLPAVTCTYKCYDGETALEAVPELISEDEYDKIKNRSLLDEKSNLIEKNLVDYDEILNHWRVITKKMMVNIVVLDMPLLDTRQTGKDLTGTFVADLVLQILSYVAQTERENIRQRQQEGIAAAKLRGVRFGRPKKERPVELEQITDAWRRREISSREAARQLGIAQDTFLRWSREG